MRLNSDTKIRKSGISKYGNRSLKYDGLIFKPINRACESDPSQNRLEYKKIYNLVDEAENECKECGEYHTYQGRNLRPAFEALSVWIEIEERTKKKRWREE